MDTLQKCSSSKSIGQSSDKVEKPENNEFMVPGPRSTSDTLFQRGHPFQAKLPIYKAAKNIKAYSSGDMPDMADGPMIDEVVDAKTALSPVNICIYDNDEIGGAIDEGMRSDVVVENPNRIEVQSSSGMLLTRESEIIRGFQEFQRDKLKSFEDIESPIPIEEEIVEVEAVSKEDSHGSNIQLVTQTLSSVLIREEISLSDIHVPADPITRTAEWLKSLKSLKSDPDVVYKEYAEEAKYEFANYGSREPSSDEKLRLSCNDCSPSSSCSTIAHRSSFFDDEVRIIKTNPKFFVKPKLEGNVMGIVSDPKFADSEIRIDAFHFGVHLCILKAYSSLFKAVVESDPVIAELPSNEVTVFGFQQLYWWMIQDEPKLQREGLLEVLKAAEYLQVYDLLNHIWQLLGDELIQEDHAFILYMEACSLDLPTVRSAMLERISKFFLTLVSSREYMQMDPDDVVHLLSSNRIAVNSEIEVLMSGVRWLNYNWSERVQYAVKIMEAVRFSLMPPWFLGQIVNGTYSSTELDSTLKIFEVDLMIHEALSASLMMYNEHPSEKCQSARSPLIAQRLWIFDSNCSYHSKGQKQIEIISYANFVKYLDFLSTTREYYFKNIELLTPDILSI